ncbi:flavodoxin family protein [Streptomyces sp. GC420]|uniref:flavodoxin family protein n=1 Tax=Streptomyces sp. GC420 TaxID=2697568 RepID=UPI001415143B|nr:NAD(P)H-dependent oxidoreductase [Streptomyces sp. GC420]NBM15687.1 flavodoxin [Streptomyces sp. GC420]
MARSFLFLLASSRTESNSELLARRAAEQLPPDVRLRWLRLRDHPLPDFEDIRHEGDGTWPAPEGAAALLLDATLDATDLVIVSPLYWYSVSADAKRYLDHWAAWMRVPGVDFRQRMAGRTLWGVSALAGTDLRDAEPLVGTLRRSAAYMGMPFGGALLGRGNRPKDVLGDEDALRRAKTFFH